MEPDAARVDGQLRRARRDRLLQPAIVEALNSITPEQTLIARLFAGAATATTYSAPLMWNLLLRDLARERGLGGLETARLFALAHMAWHDALLVSFYGKSLYGFWRPTTAISRSRARRCRTPSAYPFPCRDFGCSSPDMRLTLTRK